MNQQEESIKETKMSLLYWLFVIILFLWLGSWVLLKDLDGRGTFGDMFGGINALFSGFAFAGVVFAIFLQKNGLELQRQELKDTRKELAGQKEQLEAQNKTLQKQNFENTFFQLLKTHTDILNSIVISPERTNTNTPTFTGRDCFEKFYGTYKGLYSKYKNKHSGWNIENIISESYKEFYETRQSEIGHYFLFLYNIVKYINESDVEKKEFYSNLVRAQLSYHELSLLFYNCLSVPENNKMKPLIESFSLFKNLPVTMLINGSDDLQLYQPKAFKSQEKRGQCRESKSR